MSATYCEIPWVGLTLEPDGQPSICCEALSAPGLHRDERGRALDARTHALEELRESTVFRRVRSQLLAGEKPRVCHKCWQDEEVGVTSMRQNRGRGHLTLEAARRNTEPSGALRAEAELPLVLELRLSNVCNLRCRMCGPSLSSAWHVDATALGDFGARRFGVVPAAGGPVVELDSPQFRESVERALPRLRRLIFTGGEPFLQERHYEILDALVSRGRAGEVSLSYTTNLTILPDRLLALWERFATVQVGVSIEGVGSTQEYVRYPSRWDRVEANIRRLDTLASERGWPALLQTTVSAYNVLSLEELADWYLGAGLRAFRKLELRRLWSPAHLSVRVLPPAAKAEARESAERVACRLRQAAENSAPGMPADRADFLRQTAGSLEGLIRFMECDSESSWEEFVAYTRALDRIRGQDFATALPRLARYLCATSAATS